MNPNAKSAVPAEPVKEIQAIKELLEKDYEAQVLQATQPVALDFYSAGSAPCAALAPRFGAVAEKFAERISFFKVLRESNEGLAKKLNVTASPTLIFFKSGKELGERLTGDDIKRTSLKASVEALLK
jgi:thioredoxin-like negative regulator of GroEL